VAGLKLHFGMFTSLLWAPLTEHVRFTAPLNPPPGFTEMGVVDVLPALLTMGELSVNDNPSVCPVPFPQLAVQATSTGADAADAV
jgi:hypothetical protein